MASKKTRIDALLSLLSDTLEEFETPFLSSSFQTQSLVLLWAWSRVAPNYPVVFLDTGFHFPETLIFRDTLVDDLGLTLEIIRSVRPLVDQLGKEESFIFERNPDHCCYVNKVEPMFSYSTTRDLWVSGIRADQSITRSARKPFERSGDGTPARLHPMINWTSADVDESLRQLRLPEHPLTEKGFDSVGCMPCTERSTGPNQVEDTRSGRWHGLAKTECGLHLPISPSGEEL